MPAYEIKIVFETDRELTEDEKNLISGACQAQVTEPADENGDDMNVNVNVQQVFFEKIN